MGPTAHLYSSQGTGPCSLAIFWLPDTNYESFVESMASKSLWFLFSPLSFHLNPINVSDSFPSYVETLPTCPQPRSYIFPHTGTVNPFTCFLPPDPDNPPLQGCQASFVCKVSGKLLACSQTSQGPLLPGTGVSIISPHGGLPSTVSPTLPIFIFPDRPQELLPPHLSTSVALVPAQLCISLVAIFFPDS